MPSIQRVWGVMAIFTAVASVGCGSDSDADSGTEQEAPLTNVEYLALGDSVVYGENLFVPDTVEARPNGDAFIGYPDLIGAEVFDGNYANLGCPGATTASYLSLDGDDNGCRDFQELWGNTLHTRYSGTQADKAIEILKTNPVKLVTVGLGGNDLLRSLKKCSEDSADEEAALACAVDALPQTIKKGAANLKEIVAQIREHFDGEIIYVNVYSTYASESSASFGIFNWNNGVGPSFEDAGGEIADAFAAFRAGAESAEGDPCAAGLLAANPEEGELPACDIHPSEKGARLLADTVAAVPGFSP
jgi:lysophospholipase L1-like esterase